MAAPESNDRTSVWPAFLAVGAMVVCCAGPLLLALAATGVGAAAVRSGVALGGAAVAALVIAGLIWWRRRGCACAPDAALPGAGERRAPGNGGARERREPTRVR